LIWYAKDRRVVKFRKLFLPKSQKTIDERYRYIIDENERVVSLSSEQIANNEPILDGQNPFWASALTSQGFSQNTTVEYLFKGQVFHPGNDRHWSMGTEKLDVLAKIGRLAIWNKQLVGKRYLDDFPSVELTNEWADTVVFRSTEIVQYVVQTSPKVIQRCILMTTDPGDLVLDPTGGSGTTGYVSEQWGRRWITIDTSRVALALARTRLMAAKFPYYILSDSPEGISKEAELTGKIPSTQKTENDIKKGFVYKRVPHITLKSIANNPDIKEGMGREEIDAAIARHADTEMLYDQPYEDNKRIRVSGPFTVESLSPHRVLSEEKSVGADGVCPTGHMPCAPTSDPSQFVHMILENLKKAGVQSTVKKERLIFDRLEPYAGVYLQGQGEYTEAPSLPPSPARGEGDKGQSKRVAICIGPEHGTVGPELLKEAAKEAVKGIGFDLLVVCGFAFDPHVSEEAKHFGKLTVLTARMNPDLAMGDELLKKTGAGNLFMVFGEPDLEVKKQKDGKITVEIKGVDVYDPTTGQIRSHSTDDIACWFIDTDYNEESFFVRHAYFCGADEPYEKLKKALRAEIDEAAWSSLYTTKSRPFDPPTTGKIAVKVINHYGDEVLKVYKV
jgi:adenine-specific DNA-methyltransferase